MNEYLQNSLVISSTNVIVNTRTTWTTTGDLYYKYNPDSYNKYYCYIDKNNNSWPINGIFSGNYTFELLTKEELKKKEQEEKTKKLPRIDLVNL